MSLFVLDEQFLVEQLHREYFFESKIESFGHFKVVKIDPLAKNDLGSREFKWTVTSPVSTGRNLKRAFARSSECQPIA